MASESYDPDFWRMIAERRKQPTISREELEASLTRMKTFMDIYLSDEVKSEQIDDFVEAWHKGDGNHLTLSAYLGMTPDEYNMWLIDASALPRIRDARTQQP